MIAEELERPRQHRTVARSGEEPRRVPEGVVLAAIAPGPDLLPYQADERPEPLRRLPDLVDGVGIRRPRVEVGEDRVDLPAGDAGDGRGDVFPRLEAKGLRLRAAHRGLR